MPKSRSHFVALLLALPLACATARADVSLAPLFRDHAILQRDQLVPVWGHAEPGENITVTYRGQTIGATTGRDGRWIACLEPMSAAIEPAELTVTGKNTVTLHDVLVGEVWLASGQSNMFWQIRSLPDAAGITAKIRNPYVRQIAITLTTATAPADTVPTPGWQPADPETSAHFSAVAWYFASELQRKLGVPVGIIHSSWPGSNIEAWIDARTLRATPAWPAIDARWQALLLKLPRLQADYTAWNEAKKELQAKGRPVPPAPPFPGGPGTQHALSELFNGMIAPLQPYALRGVIWYQGESNWEQPREYAGLFPAMITAWRAQWGRDDLPFYFVQLPGYAQPDDATGRGWAWLREAQAQALDLPATAMAVTIDCGDPKNLHPHNKAVVGRRLARLAEAKLYDITGDWSGPRYASAQREGAALRVHFDHAATGLISERTPPRAFELAGVDRKFHPATATIERDTVLVTSPAVPDPVAVRYAWTNAPDANLFNGAGLPAAPFRSDDW
jgi:sialate O-acetylesterase